MCNASENKPCGIEEAHLLISKVDQLIEHLRVNPGDHQLQNSLVRGVSTLAKWSKVVGLKRAKPHTAKAHALLDMLVSRQGNEKPSAFG